MDKKIPKIIWNFLDDEGNIPKETYDRQVIKSARDEWVGETATAFRELAPAYQEQEELKKVRRMEKTQESRAASMELRDAKIREDAADLLKIGGRKETDLPGLLADKYKKNNPQNFPTSTRQLRRIIKAKNKRT